MESLLKKVTGKKDNSSSADSADAAEKPTPGSVSSTPAHSAKDVIAALNLAPHPEKGFFTETFRDSAIDTATGRAHSTQIYYLLEGESGLSHWHRVRDAVEVWHYYAGAPLRLSLSHDNGEPVRDVVLGSDLWAVCFFSSLFNFPFPSSPYLPSSHSRNRRSWCQVAVPNSAQ